VYGEEGMEKTCLMDAGFPSVVMKIFRSYIEVWLHSTVKALSATKLNIYIYLIQKENKPKENKF
jgi:hypothetical protein